MRNNNKNDKMNKNVQKKKKTDDLFSSCVEFYFLFDIVSWDYYFDVNIINMSAACYQNHSVVLATFSGAKLLDGGKRFLLWQQLKAPRVLYLYQTI